MVARGGRLSLHLLPLLLVSPHCAGDNLGLEHTSLGVRGLLAFLEAGHGNEIIVRFLVVPLALEFPWTNLLDWRRLGQQTLGLLLKWRFGAIESGLLLSCFHFFHCR